MMTKMRPKCCSIDTIFAATARSSDLRVSRPSRGGHTAPLISVYLQWYGRTWLETQRAVYSFTLDAASRCPATHRNADGVHPVLLRRYLRTR